MKKCPYCGCDNINSSKFCYNCKKTLFTATVGSGNGEKENNGASQTDPENDQPSQTVSDNKTPVNMKIVTVCGAAAAAVIAFILGSSSSPPPKNNNIVTETTTAKTTAETTAAAPETEPPEETQTETEPPVQEPATKLTILCWDSADIVPMLEVYCLNTNHSKEDFNIVNFSCDGNLSDDKYYEYLSDPEADADIMFLESEWAYKFFNDDSAETGTVPLSEIGFSERDYESLYDFSVKVGQSDSGVQKGLPWQCTAGGYCYREDLAEKYLNVSSPEEMQSLVSDWDKFMDTAAMLKEASYGQTSITASIRGIWNAMSSVNETPWVIDNKPQIDEHCKQDMLYMREMVEKGYIYSSDVDPWKKDWYDLGQTESILGYFLPSWGLGDIRLTQAAGGIHGSTYRKWRMVEGPESYYWGYCCMGVASRCDDPEFAKEFISFFTVDEKTAREYSLYNDEFLANKNAMKYIIDNDLYKGADVLGGQNHFPVLYSNATAINADVLTPYDSVIKAALVNTVRDFTQGKCETPDDAKLKFCNYVVADLPDMDYSDFF